MTHRKVEILRKDTVIWYCHPSMPFLSASPWRGPLKNPHRNAVNQECPGQTEDRGRTAGHISG